MATFPSIDISYGANKSSKPATRVVRFGDGYEQRLTFGLNQNPKVWSVSWNYLSETDADTVEAFLDARAADGASFDWTPPDESTSYKWVCESWDKKIDYPTLATITATFRQVFEP